MYTSQIISVEKSAQQNWESVCQYMGLDPVKCLPEVSGVPLKHQKFTQSAVKIAIATEALNQEFDKAWFADYFRKNVKYEHLVEIEGSEAQPSGFAFSSSGCGVWHSYSFVGSRFAACDPGIILLIQNCLLEDLHNFYITPSSPAEVK